MRWPVIQIVLDILFILNVDGITGTNTTSSPDNTIPANLVTTEPITVNVATAKPITANAATTEPTTEITTFTTTNANEPMTSSAATTEPITENAVTTDPITENVTTTDSITANITSLLDVATTTDQTATDAITVNDTTNTSATDELTTESFMNLTTENSVTTTESVLNNVTSTESGNSSVDISNGTQSNASFEVTTPTTADKSNNNVTKFTISQNKPIEVVPSDAECTNTTFELPEYIKANFERYLPESINFTIRYRCAKTKSASCLSSVTIEKEKTIRFGLTGDFKSQNLSINSTLSADEEDTDRHFVDYWIPNSIASPITWLFRLQLHKKLSKSKEFYETQTVVDAGAFKLKVENSKLVFKSGYEASNSSFSLNAGPVMLDEWVQVAVQENIIPIKIKQLKFFINDNPGLSFTDDNNTNHRFPWFRNILFGQPFSNDSDLSVYEVMIRDFIVYHDILSEREIADLYTNKTTTLIRPGCGCLSTAPNIMGSFCTNSAGRAYPKTPTEVDISWQNGQQHLILENRFLKEYMNDGIRTPIYHDTRYYEHTPFTFWMSAPGAHNFSIDIDFQGNFTVEAVDLILLKPVPEKSLTIYKKGNNEWEAWHYFADDCKTLGFSNTDEIAGDAINAGCTSYQTAGVTDSRGPYWLQWNPMNTTQEFGSDGSNKAQAAVFFRSSGIRLTFDGLPRGNYTSEKEQYHAVAEITVEGSNDKCRECYPAGTDPGNSCSCSQCSPNQQCPCRKGVNKALAGKQCMPYIEKLFPTYGPLAGGTNITIIGGVFGSGNVAVTVGELRTTILQSNSSYVLCKTPALTNSTRILLSQPLAISLKLASNFTLKHHQPFVYKLDPVVTSISPKKSIATGGIMQTVVGQNLDSVYTPKLYVLYTSINNYSEMFGSKDCKVINGTQMKCPTPDVSSTVNPPEVNNTQTPIRRRRSVNKELNNEFKNWGILLKFDGLKKYMNPEWATKNAQLLMHHDPEIFPFSPEIKDFEVDKGHHYIEIKGYGLQIGIKEDNYMVNIGNGTCELESLADNLIICSPPGSPPDAEAHDKHQDSENTFRVKVGIGLYLKKTPGFLRYILEPPKNWIVPLIVCIVLLLLVLLVGFLIYRILKRNQKKDGFIKYIDLTDDLNHYVGSKKGLLDLIDAGLKERVKPCLIDEAKFTCNKILGEGFFGIVYKADLKDKGGAIREVAVKTIKAKDGSVAQISELLEEALVMKDFTHEHILALIGIAIWDYEVYILLPYMEKGSLRSYVQNSQNTFTLIELVGLTTQACKGMVYLESQKFVHRDLAARNCMVDEKITVKIADFGLARDIYEKGYYKPEDTLRPLPYKWMAMECLVIDQQFTTKSDVWSFGVLLWEVVTRGRVPYSGISNKDLGNYLRSNKRLEKPSHCPDELYDVMKSCWQVEPESRPSFTNLLETLGSIEKPYASSNNEAHYENSPNVEGGDNLAFDYRDHYMAPVKLATHAPDVEEKPDNRLI